MQHCEQGGSRAACQAEWTHSTRAAPSPRRAPPPTPPPRSATGVSCPRNQIYWTKRSPLIWRPLAVSGALGIRRQIRCGLVLPWCPTPRAARPLIRPIPGGSIPPHCGAPEPELDSVSEWGDGPPRETPDIADCEPRRAADGRMFRLTRNRLPGSYRFLSSTRRWKFAP